MEIASLSIASSQFKLQQEVQLSMLNKVMDISEAQRNGLYKMLESADVKTIQQSVQSHLGTMIDIKA